MTVLSEPTVVLLAVWIVAGEMTVVDIVEVDVIAVTSVDGN